MRMGRKRVPEREAPPRSMEVTSPEEEEQVIARHAHGDGACGSQSERKLKGSEETCKCLKCIKNPQYQVQYPNNVSCNNEWVT